MKVTFREIEEKDNAAVQAIIRGVMPEFGAGGFGFAIHDSEVLHMYQAYSTGSSAYFVCEVNGAVVGGGGIAPLQGGPAEICELKKMYFLSVARGKGYGRQLLDQCITKAKMLGYKQVYIETFNTMKDAIRLYELNGFYRIPSALGNTGHFACDTFYLLDL